MAGTLTISTLSDGTNSTSATNCIQGSAKAWVMYNGASIGGSYNVSSITSIATGIFRVNMTNAMTDANYAYVVTVVSSNSYDRNMAVFSTTSNDNASVTSPTTTTFCFKINSNGSTATNYNEPFSAAVFR